MTKKPAADVCPAPAADRDARRRAHLQRHPVSIFFDLSFQNGRLYGSLIDVFNRAHRALLAVGMTLSSRPRASTCRLARSWRFAVPLRRPRLRADIPQR